MSALERPAGRRNFLLRAAAIGTALAASPVRYLTRPAWADHINCKRREDCPGGAKCRSGYTAFCCTVTGKNECPANTFIGGFWRCTYTGSGLCDGSDRRFYIDCHADPGKRCSHCGGRNCHCAKNKCSNRRSCCTKFRYGQCNRNIDPPRSGDNNFMYTSDRPIKCRMVKCSNPGHLYPERCDPTPIFEDNTCAHNPGC